MLSWDKRNNHCFFFAGDNDEDLKDLVVMITVEWEIIMDHVVVDLE